MKFTLARVLVLALAADTAVASSWFAKAPYNKWHETELERWLSDHDVPYPKAADRKDLQNIVKDNWQAIIESPYANWDTDRLQKYLKDQGHQIQKGAESNKDHLVSQVKSIWHDADAEAHSTYDDITSWIFNTWSNSQLKSFLDRHGIPVPQPFTSDKARQVARDNYQTLADKAGETASYPGSWLYEAWTDSDLKVWLDQHGVTIPGATSREKMIAAVRRNSYLSRNKLADYASSASSVGTDYASSASSGAAGYISQASSGAAGYAAQASVSAASMASDASAAAPGYASAASSAAAGYASQASSGAAGYASQASAAAPGYASAASSVVGKYASSATSAAAGAAQSISDALFDSWSDSQLKEWADKNGIKVPQGSKRNEVLAVVRKYAAKLTGDNVSASGASVYGAATSKAGNEFASATSGLAYQVSSLAGYYYSEAMIALGLHTNYASSASATVSSAYGRATAAVKGEL